MSALTAPITRLIASLGESVMRSQWLAGIVACVAFVCQSGESFVYAGGCGCEAPRQVHCHYHKHCRHGHCAPPAGMLIQSAPMMSAPMMMAPMMAAPVMAAPMMSAPMMSAPAAPQASIPISFSMAPLQLQLSASAPAAAPSQCSAAPQAAPACNGSAAPANGFAAAPNDGLEGRVHDLEARFRLMEDDLEEILTNVKSLNAALRK